MIEAPIDIKAKPTNVVDFTRLEEAIASISLVSRELGGTSHSEFGQSLIFSSTVKSRHPGSTLPPISAFECLQRSVPDCDLWERSRISPDLCLANKNGEINGSYFKLRGPRCGWHMRKGYTQIATHAREVNHLLNDLSRLSIFADTVMSIATAKELIGKAVCHNQQEYVFRRFKAFLRADLRRFLRRSSTVAALDSEILLGDREEPEGFLHYIPAYSEYIERVPQNVLQVARQPLYDRGYYSSRQMGMHAESQQGYLYVYWNRAVFGLFKIGFTTKDVRNVRLPDWESKCLHIAELVYESPVKVNYAARLEKIIHAEFRDYRVEEKECLGCGGRHIEWFRGLQLSFIKQRIEAWSAWAKTRPYDTVMLPGRDFSIPTIPEPTASLPRSQVTTPRKSPRKSPRKAALLEQRNAIPPPRWNLRSFDLPLRPSTSDSSDLSPFPSPTPRLVGAV